MEQENRNKIRRHAEFISASHLVAVLKSGEILKRVQDDNIFKGVGPVLRPYGAPLRSGFTLIELLVVVLIVGILAAVALPQYQKAVIKSRYATLMATADALATAEEVYYMANGSYTDDFEALAVEPAGCTLSDDKTTCTYTWGKCTLDTRVDDIIVCANTQTLNNGYVRPFQHGKHINWGTKSCLSFSADPQDKYSKLCEQLGGIKVLDYSQAVCNPGYGHCSIYRL